MTPTSTPSPIVSLDLHESTGVRSPKRAEAHSSGRRIALLGAGLACFAALSSCGEQQAAPAPGSENPELVIQRLIELSTELDPTLTSDYHDRHFHAKNAFVTEMRGASRGVGLAALRTFQEFQEGAERQPDLVMNNLLDVAAHAATEETVPLLEVLTLEYGHDISDRTQGMLLLGQVAPARAVELLTPLLKKTKNTSTMPDDEFILRAFIDGCTLSGADPVPVLADVASNIFKQDAARHRALQELGNHSDPLAQETLRFMLVESTGNSYVRIKTAQSILKSFPREQACAIFLEVSQKEADINFLQFLADMIQDNCE